MENDDKKIETLNSIFEAVIKLEALKGNLKWTISDLARSSNVSRALIYYYFEKKEDQKKLILKESWNYMLKTIFALDDEEQLGMVQRTYNVLQKVRQNPFLFILFHLEKEKPNEIGELIREKEQQFLSMLKQLNPNFTDEQIKRKYILQIGIMSLKENLSLEEISKILSADT